MTFWQLGMRVTSTRRWLGGATRVVALGAAAFLAGATSGGEANDEEDIPGGNSTGSETTLGDDEVDFTDVTEPTTVVVGGNDFVLTADGRFVLALRTEWFGGGGETTELRSRRLVAIDTRTGIRTSELDLRPAGRFGVVLLADPARFVVVHREEDDTISGLETVRLPDLVVESSYVPQTRGNTVRLSPNGRFAALWTVSQLGWPGWNLYLTVPDLVVGIEDLQNAGTPLLLTSPWGVADVVAALNGSAFYIALSTRDPYATASGYFMEVFRVQLGPNLPTDRLLIEQAGHASDSEIKGGSALRLSPTGDTLTFDGCSFATGTCVARWFVMNTAGLSLRGDLRAAGAAAFTPDGRRAIGWDGQSTSQGKIWVADCIFGEEDPDHTDHWLVDVDLQTFDAQVIDLPKLAPYYFVTRDGAYAVASVENCDVEELWAVDLQTGSASAIRNADHGLHHFTVMPDHRTIYSVDRGVLERIDLDARESVPTTYASWASRINRLPDRPRLVLSDPDGLVFTLWDVQVEGQVWRVDLTGLGATPPAPPHGVPRPASGVKGFWRSAPKLRRIESSERRRLAPRLPGGAVGREIRL